MVGNGVWLHNIGRVVKQKLHNNLTPSKMKKGVDSFKIGCYSDKAVAQNCALKKGCRGVKKLLKKEKDS